MTVTVGAQGAALLWAMALGLGLGVIYDMGRALRRQRPGTTAAVDLTFAAVYYLALWLTAIYMGGLRLFQCLGVCVSAGTYFLTVSPHLVVLFQRVLYILGNVRRKIRRILKKFMYFFRKNAKKVFPSACKCATIYSILFRQRRRERRL